MMKELTVDLQNFYKMRVIEKLSKIFCALIFWHGSIELIELYKVI